MWNAAAAARPSCGNRAGPARILEQAGIDPLELDASCLLVTDGCPMCGSKGQYTVQIFRVSAGSETRRPPYYGTA